MIEGPENPRYRLTFRALPGDVPPVIRLRGLLKVALRAFGLRCSAVEEMANDGPEVDAVLVDAAIIQTAISGKER